MVKGNRQSGTGSRRGASPLVSLACILLALALVFGYVPLPRGLAAFSDSSAGIAYADEDGESGSGDAGGDGGGAMGGDAGGDTGGNTGGDAGGGAGGNAGGNTGDDTGEGAGGDGGGDAGEGAGGNTGGDGGDDPGDPGGEDPPAPETYYVSTLLLKWDKPDNHGVTHFVGDNSIVEKAYRQIKITEFGETVQLHGWYLSTDETGVAYQTADSSTAIGSFMLSWQSSDEEVATVSPDGLVTPHGKNGTVVITATVEDAQVYEDVAPSATVSISFDGQEGKYVKKVEILDEEGKEIGETWGGVTVYSEENTFHQLQARVTWYNVVDGSEEVELTGTGDSYDASQVGTTVIWSVSTSTAFTINEDTGRLRAGAYSGNAFVTCTVIGGLGGENVTDTANVQLDTGTYEYHPSDSLELKVVWEERPDEVAKEATYTFDELKAKLTSKHVNATVMSDSRFGVISAEGFLFKDVVGLVAVDDGDVLQYRFSTADGYDNPVSYKYLFESGPRYYFPNWDIGSRAEGEIVPPVLAYKSSFEWGKSEANPNVELDEGTRFRLVFGCLASGDANTSFQIYYIRGITIVLKGGPSAGKQDTPTTPSSENSGGSGGNSGGGSGKGGKGKGSSGSGSGSAGTGGANSSGNMAGTNGDGREAAGASQAASTDDTASGEEAAEAEAATTGETAEADADAGKRWRVYQMMNKNNSDVPDWDDENPIAPFAAPLALGTFAIGASATGLGFRRRLR